MFVSSFSSSRVEGGGRGGGGGGTGDVLFPFNPTGGWVVVVVTGVLGCLPIIDKS